MTKNSYLLLQHSIFTFTTRHENVTIDINFYNKNLRDSAVYFYNKLERIIGTPSVLYNLQLLTPSHSQCKKFSCFYFKVILFNTTFYYLSIHVYMLYSIMPAFRSKKSIYKRTFFSLLIFLYIIACVERKTVTPIQLCRAIIQSSLLNVKKSIFIGKMFFQSHMIKHSNAMVCHNKLWIWFDVKRLSDERTIVKLPECRHAKNNS